MRLRLWFKMDPKLWLFFGKITIRRQSPKDTTLHQTLIPCIHVLFGPLATVHLSSSRGIVFDIHNMPKRSSLERS